jgi:hypothetical protein
MRLPRPKFTVRRCLIGVALIALLLSRLDFALTGDVRGVWLHLGCSSVAGLYYDGLAGRYEAVYWSDVWRGKTPLGVGYDPRKHEWVRNPSPQ